MAEDVGGRKGLHNSLLATCFSHIRLRVARNCGLFQRELCAEATNLDGFFSLSLTICFLKV